MGVVGDMRAHVQCGACLEPGGIDHCTVQDEATPAANPLPPQLHQDRNRRPEATRQAQPYPQFRQNPEEVAPDPLQQ